VGVTGGFQPPFHFLDGTSEKILLFEEIQKETGVLFRLNL